MNTWSIKPQEKEMRKVTIKKKVLTLVIVMYLIPPAAWFAMIFACGLVSWPEWKLLLIPGGVAGWIPYVAIYNSIMFRLASKWLRPIEDVLQGRDLSEQRKEEARKSIYRFPLRLFIAEVLYAAYGGYSALTGVFLLTGQTPPMMDERFLVVEFSSQAVILFTAIPFLFILTRTLNTALKATGLSKELKGFNLKRQFLIGNFGLSALAILAIAIFYYGRTRRFGFPDMISILVIVGICYLFNRIIVKQILGVLQRMFAKIALIGKGDLTQRVEILSADEFGELAAAFNEMTEHLRSSRAGLEKAKAYSEGILSTMIDGLDVIDTNGICMDMNAYLLNLLGYQKEEVVGKFAPIVIAERELEKGKWLIEETLTKGAVRDFELTLVTKTKEEIPAMFNTMWLKDEQGRVNGAFAVIRDMRGTKKLIKELVHLNDEMEGKVQELGVLNQEMEDLLRVVSHDLRAPLINIQGFSQRLEPIMQETVQMLEQLAAGSSEDGIRPRVDALKTHVQRRFGESLRFISKGVEKMDTLLSLLLAISRVGRKANPIQPHDLNAILDDVLATFNHQLKERAIEVIRHPLPTQVPCRRNEINQVFSNLISNAINYMGPAERRFIEVGATAHSDHVECFVKDTGIGISPEDQERIFQMFTRLQAVEAPGEGIGLAYVKKIIRSHGGKIWVTSARGQGSTFCFTLPIQSVAASPASKLVGGGANRG